MSWHVNHIWLVTVFVDWVIESRLLQPSMQAHWWWAYTPTSPTWPKSQNTKFCSNYSVTIHFQPCSHYMVELSFAMRFFTVFADIRQLMNSQTFHHEVVSFLGDMSLMTFIRANFSLLIENLLHFIIIFFFFFSWITLLITQVPPWPSWLYPDFVFGFS